MVRARKGVRVRNGVRAWSAVCLGGWSGSIPRRHASGFRGMLRRHRITPGDIRPCCLLLNPNVKPLDNIHDGQTFAE
jgi:hypothetical protein